MSMSFEAGEPRDPNTDTGAIYVAEVRASLPDLQVVRDLYYAARLHETSMHELDERYDIEEQELHAIPGDQVRIEVPDGTPVHTHGSEQFVISDYRPLSGYFLLQSGVFDTDDEFTPHFLNIPEDAPHTGALEWHTTYQGEAALFLIPTEACNAGKLLVPSVAFLCVGNQKTTFYNPPVEDQIDHLVAAADLLLNRDTRITPKDVL